MVMVDEVMRWPTRIRCFKNGSCHLTADSLEELHRAAGELKLKREWFQDKRIPHYDLTPARRDDALRRKIAIFMPAKDQVRRRRACAVALKSV